ncbi:MAG: DUF1441 family protein [Gammaproteobacteria bacterium]|nr:DUF1441 family protein [Gammaproteobacteria bacterium]MBQ0840532.1 DUF1441 family protein [Gammaproteobacteria bacterium]
MTTPINLNSTPQRITNKAGAAEFFDVDPSTLDRWLRKGCPFVQKGSRGKSWKIDLNAVAEWHYGSDTQGGDVNPESLPPSERKAWFESEAKRRDLQVRDRELIAADEIEPAILTAFSQFAQNTQSVGDMLERRHGISAEVAEIVEGALLNYLDELVDVLSVFGPVNDPKTDT